MKFLLHNFVKTVKHGRSHVVLPIANLAFPKEYLVFIFILQLSGLVHLQLLQIPKTKEL